MLPNYIKDFLDLEDVILTKTVHADKYVKFFLDTKPRPHICPVCGNSTAKIHDMKFSSCTLIFLLYNKNNKKPPSASLANKPLGGANKCSLIISKISLI